MTIVYRYLQYVAEPWGWPHVLQHSAWDSFQNRQAQRVLYPTSAVCTAGGFEDGASAVARALDETLWQDRGDKKMPGKSRSTEKTLVVKSCSILFANVM